MALGLPSLAEAGPGRSRVRRLPSYTRPDFDERFAMWRLAGEGHSAREIGRQLGRDHHSVRRHLERHRGEGLALDLALHGKRGSAREMVQRLGNEHDFATEVEKFIATFEAWVKVEQRRIDEIANACLTRGSVTRAVPSETRPAV
jgi:IS30 family transposase